MAGIINFIRGYGLVRNLVLVAFAALCCVGIGAQFGWWLWPLATTIWLAVAYSGFYLIVRRYG